MIMRMVVLAIVCVVLAGCASAGPKAAQPPSVDVTGTWDGTFTWGYGVSPITLKLRQTGAEVAGDLLTTSTLGELRQGNGPVQGNVSGDAVTLKYPGGGIDLFVRGKTMNGFSSSGSTWILQRQ